MPETPPLVVPFVAERYAERHRLSDLISPPYDVIGPSLRARLENRHERNIVRLILPEGNGDRYREARVRLDAWRSDGTLSRDPAPAVYVLQQSFTTPAGHSHVRTGLIAAVVAEGYDGGRVKPHEKTHRGPKEDRLALMRATETMFETLFMLARDTREEFRDALRRAASGPPLAEAALDGVDIALWSVSGEAGMALAAVAGAQALYIADGHHRYETAVAFRAERPAAVHTLALIVPRTDPGLVVLPTFRMVAGGGLDRDGLERLIGKACQVDELGAGLDPARTAEGLEGGCVVCLPEGVFVVSERTDATLPRLTVNLDPAVQHLNIARVDALVVEPIRKAAGGTVTYSADASEVREAVEQGAAGVLLPATSVDDVITVADAGGFMPQKSTYFQPKVPSGLVMMPLDLQ